MPKPQLWIVAGPTASGKTAVAVELALRVGGEVVSADSMQVYRGMDILTAMPSAAEMRGVAHHMLAVASPSEKFSAAAYRQQALACIAEIRGAASGRLSAGERACTSTPLRGPSALRRRETRRCARN